MGVVSIIWAVISGGIGRLFTFFTTKPGIYVLAAILVLGAFWYTHHSGYNQGVTHQKQDEAKRIAAAQAVARIVQAKRDKITHDADVKYATEHQRAVTVTEYITREVPKIVTLEIDRKFAVPCGLVRVWDAAALSTSPSTLSYPAGGADDQACPITASTLAETGVFVIRKYIETSGQLVALQDWVTAQSGVKPVAVIFPAAKFDDLSVQIVEAPAEQADPHVANTETKQGLGEEQSVTQHVASAGYQTQRPVETRVARRYDGVLK